MKKWQHIQKGLSGLLFLAAFAIAATQAEAQLQVGGQMDKFQLQSTEGGLYGTQNANRKVSVLFFVGYS